MTRPGGRPTVWVAPAIGALAFACRLYPVLHGGGLHGLAGYDDGVYYSAADAVVAGQVPYRDFVLLHPPGLIYLLTPFAALGHVIGDANGWAVARLAMMAVGALSAVLVFLVGRRFGLVAAIGGGLLYAVWVPAINGETSTFLECVPNALLLTALLLLGSRRTARSSGLPLLAGAALGLATSIKIWGVVPLLVVLGWQLLAAGWRRAATVLAGSVAAAVVVCGVPFALAPGRMTVLVIRDQLQRSGVHTALLDRAADFTPVHRLLPHAGSALELAAVILVGLVGVLAAVLASQDPRARVFVALLVAQGAVLCGSPPYFTHYGAFLAPAVVLTGAVGAQRVADRLAVRASGWRPVAIGLMGGLVALAAVPVVTHPSFIRVDSQRIQAAVADRRCVSADSPAVLALAGVLTRNLDRGCPTRIDVSGVTYNVDRVVGSNGRSVPRARNSLWQRDVMAYLLSGQAAITTRSAVNGLSRTELRELARKGVLYRGNGITVYG
ncbi:MAG: glycosyltransferase 87 family protein [Actinomycetota bacterium]|nr:glycosyltransferase 87 family protein [Actinomycetota bacterium]